MYLADVTIKQYLKDGLIEVVPSVKKEDIRPVGIRVHLAKDILVPKAGYVDFAQASNLEYETVDIEAKEFILEPGAFILASTVEKVRTASNIIAFLDGRSTIARLGVTIHITAGVIDGNHDNARTVTLEIKNLGVHSIRFRKNDALGQLMFALLSEDIRQESQSQYSGQNGVLPPNLNFKPGIDK